MFFIEEHKLNMELIKKLILTACHLWNACLKKKRKRERKKKENKQKKSPFYIFFDCMIRLKRLVLYVIQIPVVFSSSAAALLYIVIDYKGGKIDA